MDILTLNSKVNIACKICDKCCEYRGDIKITSINVCMISKFLGISTSEFINNYTHDVEGEFPEIAINGIGEKRICVFNDRSTNKCTIHKVRPMQCAMFPLVPENLNQDFFINSGDCVYDNQKKMNFIHVICEFSHWEEKSRNVITTCIDHNLIVPDAVLIKSSNNPIPPENDSMRSIYYAIVRLGEESEPTTFWVSSVLMKNGHLHITTSTSDNEHDANVFNAILRTIIMK